MKNCFLLVTRQREESEDSRGDSYSTKDVAEVVAEEVEKALEHFKDNPKT